MEVGSALNTHWITSVVAVPVAVVVTTVAQAPEEIALVPSAEVPLAMVYPAVPPAPNATEEESVPVKVRVLLAVSVLPLAIVNVALVAGAVIATLLIEVAAATPRDGVVSDAFVIAVPLESVPGRSVAAMARNAGAPAVVVANIACVAVVLVGAATNVTVAAFARPTNVFAVESYPISESVPSVMPAAERTSKAETVRKS